MAAIGHAWAMLVQSVAFGALILTGLGLILGVVKPTDVLKHVLAILGIAIGLILIPVAFMNLWAEIPFWQRVGLVAIGSFIWLWRRTQRLKHNRAGK